MLLQVTERFYANKKDQVIQAVTFSSQNVGGHLTI